MKHLIEIMLATLVLSLFTFSIYSIELNRIEENYIKMLVYEILYAYEKEIRDYAFRNASGEIKSILTKNLPMSYEIDILICSEKNYSYCFRNLTFQSPEIFSISYFLASDFSSFENLELIVYVQKKA